MMVPLPDSAPLTSRPPAWSTNTTETRTRLGNTAAIAWSMPVTLGRAIGDVGADGVVAGVCAATGRLTSATASGRGRTNRVTEGFYVKEPVLTIDDRVIDE